MTCDDRFRISQTCCRYMNTMPMTSQMHDNQFQKVLNSVCEYRGGRHGMYKIIWLSWAIFQGHLLAGGFKLFFLPVFWDGLLTRTFGLADKHQAVWGPRNFQLETIQQELGTLPYDSCIKGSTTAATFALGQRFCLIFKADPETGDTAGRSLTRPYIDMSKAVPKETAGGFIGGR